MIRLARAAALALTTALVPLSAGAESLTDALILAYRHSGLLEQNRAALRAADEDVAQAIALLRPIIGYSASVTRAYTFPNDRAVGLPPFGSRIEDEMTDSANFAISADLLLWDGGATRLSIDAAKELVLVSRQTLLSVEQIVLIRAVSAYVNVRQAEAIVNLRQSNVRLLGQQSQAAQDRFDVGEVTRTDVALAESRQATARAFLSAAIGDLEVARAEYREATGQLPGTLAPPGNLPQTAVSLDAAQAVAVRTHPEIERDQRLITVAELNVARAEAAIKPQIRGNASVAVGNDFEERAQIGVTMSGPIYRGGQLTSIYREAQAQRDGNRAQLHQTVHDIERAVATAWARLQSARANIAATNQAIDAATVAFRGTQEEALLGARTTLDVLDAEQELLNARVNAVSARTTEILAVYSVLQAMGLLTVSHLNLGIVQYDPNAYYEAVKDAPVRKVSPQGEKLDLLLRSLGK